MCVYVERERERERESGGGRGGREEEEKARMMGTGEELGKTVDMSAFKQMHVRGGRLRPTDIS